MGHRNYLKLVGVNITFYAVPPQIITYLLENGWEPYGATEHEWDFRRKVNL
jgi:hypothetical protein